MADSEISNMAETISFYKTRKEYFNEKYTKLISTILFLAVILGCMPISAIATEIEQVSTQIEEEILAPEDTKVTELVSAREENVKHFKLPNGTYEAVSYGQAVHRKDADGVWQDINNDLTLKTVGTKQLYTTEDERVSFNKEANAFTLSENGYSISMTLLTQQSSGNMTATTEPMTIEVDNQSVARAEYYDTLEAAIEINNKSSIVYSNVMANTDIEYIMSGNDLKENIIVKAKGDSYVYGFQLALSGLVPVLENNVISLRDETTDEEKYIIPAPYMYDANGEYSYDVEYGLVHAGGEKYLLTVTANEEWINDESRALPVTIDPAVQSYTSVWDTYIDSANPTQNYGSSSELWISSTKTTLIRMYFPPSIPDEAILNSANLYVYYYYHITTGAMSVGAYWLRNSWEEYSVNYNSRPSLSATQLSSAQLLASSAISESSPGLAIFSVTDAVSTEYERDTFKGIALTRLSGSNASVILKSYEAGSTHRAYIRINYTFYLENGVYALQNVYNTSRWMTMDSELIPGSKLKQTYSTASPISATTYNSNMTFKVTRVGSTSRYIIRLMNNQNLTLSLSGSEFIAKYIDPTDTNVGAEQTFYIEWNGSGYTLRQYNTTKVICMTSQSTATLAAEEQSDMGTSVLATWKFVRYSIVLYGVDSIPDENAEHDHVTALENLKNFDNNNISWHDTVLKSGSFSAQKCMEDLKEANIFVCRSHGNAYYSGADVESTMILLNLETDTTLELLLSHNTDSAEGNYSIVTEENSFSNMDLAIFMGCKTGVGGVGANNLPTAMVNRGATTAIGFTENIDCAAANAWITIFFENMYGGDTVEAAVMDACSRVIEEDTKNALIPYNIVTICGNRNFVLVAPNN